MMTVRQNKIRKMTYIRCGLEWNTLFGQDVNDIFSFFIQVATDMYNQQTANSTKHCLLLLNPTQPETTFKELSVYLINLKTTGLLETEHQYNFTDLRFSAVSCNF
jgi:hypothetical protein